MAVCDDAKECHEKAMKTCELVHDPEKGLPSKVSRVSMNGWIKSIIGYLVVITLAVMGAWGIASSQIQQNRQDIAVITVMLKDMPTKGDIYRIVNDKLSEKEKRKLMNE